jgi:hypothetical protein
MIRFKIANKIKKNHLYLSFLGLVVLVGGTPQSFSQNKTSAFTLLSTSSDSEVTISCTGSSITGAIGTFGPEDSIQINGCTFSEEVSLPISEQALIDFESLHKEIANFSCDQFLTGNLDGLTLNPGVYCFESAANLSGKLTLNGTAAGNWIFKVMGGLTATNFSMVMAGGGKKCNIWWEANSVILTNSRSIGTFLSRDAVTITGGTFYGRALARESVTITGTTITGCSYMSSITDSIF